VGTTRPRFIAGDGRGSATWSSRDDGTLTARLGAAEAALVLGSNTASADTTSTDLGQMWKKLDRAAVRLRGMGRSALDRVKEAPRRQRRAHPLRAMGLGHLSDMAEQSSPGQGVQEGRVL